MSELVNNYLSSIRRDFSGKTLNIENVAENPIQQFEIWLDDAVNSQVMDPNAMTLSTVNSEGFPSSRVVLLRGILNNKMLFYTNYSSEKSQQIECCQNIALNFFWVELNRQIRIEGKAKKCSQEQSKKYFDSRPRESKIGAWASHQSTIILSRKFLSNKVAYYEQKFEGAEIPYPEFWGGFEVEIAKIEFWQGRPNRLHDRIIYEIQSDLNWNIKRLAP